MLLTLVNAVGGGRNHHPLSENRDFSTTEHPIDLRPVCKFKFVRCGPVEKIRALYVPWFNIGGPTKFEGTLFQIIILGRKIAISSQPSIRLT